MVVVVLIRCPCPSFHLTVETICRTILLLVGMTFKLHGGMSNVVLLREHHFQVMQNHRTFTGGQIGDHGMAGERIHPARNAPHMQIMHIQNTRNLFHILD